MLSYSVSERGQSHEYQGFGLSADGVLTLTQDPDNAMVGRIDWRDSEYLDFRLLEGRPGDSGLSFARSS